MQRSKRELYLITRPRDTSFDRRGFRFTLALGALLGSALALGNLYFNLTTPKETTLASATTVHAEEISAQATPSAPGEAESKKLPAGRFLNPDPIESKVPETGKFIGVDLDHMTLFLYEDAELVAEYPVISKGRPGTKWETPSGFYGISTKEENHFSSIGKVYMPYSMQFYANFFIHGWPVYPDGSEVARGYSGGCIRLDTDDAEEIYQFASIGTPIYVYEDEQYEAPPKSPLALLALPLPSLSAKAYLAADLETGQVFAEKNADTALPIASITKLMTALVANESISYDRSITVSENAVATYGTTGALRVGEKIQASDMLYPLLLESSNDAAVALSEYYGQKTFVTLMNKQAKALDMSATHYEEPSGLSPENVASATDLYKLARYLKNRKAFIFDITTQSEKSLTSEGVVTAHTWYNNNPLRAYEPFVGGKNGYTDEARKTLLTLFKTTLAGEERTVVVVILGSEEHASETLKLLTWVKQAASGRADFAERVID